MQRTERSGRRWQPSLGLIVLLSLLILVEGVVTVGRIVLRSAPPPVACSGDLQDRGDKWCQIETAAALRNTVPSIGDFTDVLGSPTDTWVSGYGYRPRSVAGRLLYVACRGAGALLVTEYDGDAERDTVNVDCGRSRPRIDLSDGVDIIGVAPIGQVTAAEYFVQ